MSCFIDMTFSYLIAIDLQMTVYKSNWHFHHLTPAYFILWSDLTFFVISELIWLCKSTKCITSCPFHIPRRRHKMFRQSVITAWVDLTFFIQFQNSQERMYDDFLLISVDVQRAGHDEEVNLFHFFVCWCFSLKCNLLLM